MSLFGSIDKLTRQKYRSKMLRKEFKVKGCIERIVLGWNVNMDQVEGMTLRYLVSRLE